MTISSLTGMRRRTGHVRGRGATASLRQRSTGRGWRPTPAVRRSQSRSSTSDDSRRGRRSRKRCRELYHDPANPGGRRGIAWAPQASTGGRRSNGVAPPSMPAWRRRASDPRDRRRRPRVRRGSNPRPLQTDPKRRQDGSVRLGKPRRHLDLGQGLLGPRQESFVVLAPVVARHPPTRTSSADDRTVSRLPCRVQPGPMPVIPRLGGPRSPRRSEARCRTPPQAWGDPARSPGRRRIRSLAGR